MAHEQRDGSMRTLYQNQALRLARSPPSLYKKRCWYEEENLILLRINFGGRASNSAFTNRRDINPSKAREHEGMCHAKGGPRI
jgi:hypothetical protein